MSRLTKKEIYQLELQAEKLEQLHEGRQWNEPQKKIFKAAFGRNPYKKFVLRKGRKGGGTEAILYPNIRIAGLYPNRACYIIGPTAVLEEEIIWSNGRLREAIPKQWKVKFKQKERRVVFDNGSFIKVTGADDWKGLVGVEGDVFTFDEGADHDERAYRNCYPNILSRDAWWFLVSAPPIVNIKNNFFYKEEKKRKLDPNWFFLHWTTYDNAQFLPGGVDGINQLRQEYINEDNEAEFIQRYLAKYLLRGKGAVIPSFTPFGESNSHVYPLDVLEAYISQDKNKLQWWSVYDPGFATCFCVLFACYNPFSGEIFILDEIYETDRAKLSPSELWPRIREREKSLYNGRWRRLYDSAAPVFPQEVNARWRGHKDLEAEGGFEPCIKHGGDEDTYFRIMNGGFKQDFFKVSTRCKNGISELENYATKDNGNYPDENNHFLDCFRYLLKRLNWSSKSGEFSLKVIPEEEVRGEYIFNSDTNPLVSIPSPEMFLEPRIVTEERDAERDFLDRIFGDGGSDAFYY